MANKFSPYTGPDTLRAVNKTNKTLFDLHTKKACGYTDIDGSQYEGTVENFGSEVLLESRKMLLDRPSLDKLLINDDFKFYFDTRYSNVVNTYDQQNMLHALLRKDVLLSNIEYKIKFENISVVSIPRSKSSSDPIVLKDRWYRTTTPPTLIMNNTDEVSLEFSNVPTMNTVYYFHIGNDTDDIIDFDTLTLDSFMTVPITNKMVGYAFIWICVDPLKTLPYFHLENNVMYNDLPLLTIGNNGHDGAYRYDDISYGGDALVFPYMDYACIGETLSRNWFIKVISADDTAFDASDVKNIINYTSKIKEIHFLYYPGNDIPEIPNITPDVDINITYNDEYSKMMLFTENLDESGWKFHTPVLGEYDYTDKAFQNKTYAYINLGYFNDNINPNLVKLIPGFSISFSKDYHYSNKEYTINACSGIQLHNTGDTTDNGTYSKYGVIHNLGDFEGLPSYFTYMLDKGVNREMIAMYSIRDRMKDYNQTDIDKCTAGILIDSGIPKNTSIEISDDYPIGIKFSNATSSYEFRYYNDERVPVVSPNNILSEVTYTDKWIMSNCNMTGHKEEPKFFYHGDGLFSLFFEEGFGPLEIGRVYVISNDPPSYINNALLDNKKAPRTFARICDIPTKYHQLIGIDKVAPTLVIDDKYTRTECYFFYNDKDRLYNLSYTMDHFIRTANGKLVFNHMGNPDIVYSEKYRHYINLNSRVLLSSDPAESDVDITTNNRGSGYTVGSVIRFYIGGVRIEYTVAGVDVDGSITGLSTSQTYRYNVPIANFGNSNVCTFNTVTISGTGSGCTINATIDSEVWNSKQMTVDGVLPGGLCLKSVYNRTVDDYDIYGWRYNDLTGEFEENQMLVGHEEFNNRYDDKYPDTHTDILKDAILYNLLNVNKVRHCNDTESSTNKTNVGTNIPKSTDITPGENDFSDDLNESLINRQDSYYILKEATTTQTHHTSDVYEINHMNDATNEKNIIIPDDSDFGYSDYVNKSNTIRFKDDKQVSLFVYDPTASFTDIIKEQNHDISIKTGFRKFSFYNIINDPSVVNNRNVAQTDIYRSDDIYGEAAIYQLRDYYSSWNKARLIDFIRTNYPKANILNRENNITEKECIDFIIQNTLAFDDITADSYTEHPASPYRRQNISLYANIGDTITDGEFGDNINISIDTFNENVKINNSTRVTAEPSYFFKLDIDEIPEDDFLNFRMKDEYGNDISKYCVLVINYELYYPSFDSEDNITWHKFIME